VRNRLLLAALASACADDEPVVVWSGEHVELAASPDNADRLCAGTGPFLDAASEAIAARLGLPSRRVTYVWIPDGIGDTPCSELAGGCATDGIAYAPAPWIEHEIVHVHAAAFGRADPFLEEGLAEYLGGVYGTPAIGDPSAFIGHQRRIWDPQFYPTAGRWIAAAVARTSIDDVVDLYVASHFPDTAATFEALTRKHLGVDMDELETSIRASPNCSALAYRERPVACSDAPIPWDFGTWTFAVSADCDDEEIYGHRGAMRAQASFDLDALLHVRIFADDETQAIVAPCAPGCDAGDVIRVADGEHVSITLPAGRYVVEAQRDNAGPILVTAATWR
jgi:hypothetical protein